MDMLINVELIKRLRKHRSWSQDQLASISGVSLRTVQRIENEGTCSLKSKKALAAAFDIDATDLDVDVELVRAVASARKGQKYGYMGAAFGLIAAYTGISLDLIYGGMLLGDAGLYYGVVGAIVGLICAGIGLSAAREKVKKAGSESSRA